MYSLSRCSSFDQRNANSARPYCSHPARRPALNSNSSWSTWKRAYSETSRGQSLTWAINDIIRRSSFMSRLSSQFSWLKKIYHVVWPPKTCISSFTFGAFFLVLKHTFIIYPRGLIIWAHQSDFLRHALIDVWGGDRSLNSMTKWFKSSAVWMELQIWIFFYWNHIQSFMRALSVLFVSLCKITKVKFWLFLFCVILLTLIFINFDGLHYLIGPRS